VLAERICWLTGFEELPAKTRAFVDWLVEHLRTKMTEAFRCHGFEARLADDRF
jgi:hypothetical protein